MRLLITLLATATTTFKLTQA